jgi:hypothetical protein
MVMVDIDNKVYEEMSRIVKSDKLKYKSLRNYTSTAVNEYNKKNR